MSDKNSIDFVITWVDDSDPVWREKKSRYTGAQHIEGNTEARYRDWDTLKYWFRGVEKYAPWVRNVYFVTDDQKPEWLNLEHPKLKWVKHTDFIPEEYLPTFNSHTIEWNIHWIDDLSERFVYFNDDMFLIRETTPEDFFVGELPCDLPGVGILYPSGFFSSMMFNNSILLNRHFSLKDSIRQNRRKWFCHQPVSGLIKLLYLGRKNQVSCYISHHIHINYRKETYATLWSKEQDLIHETCSHKQRTKEDITPWCIRCWQLLTGNFHPQKPIGKMFSTAGIAGNGAIDYIRKQKGKVICLNDGEEETDFLKHKQMVVAAFEELLPEKSAFER